ncbi:MAG: cupin domain-containing protein [Gammaproteobacteria bacterium]|jgi:mannose-6-phosphate isomerase-like protein (cupin superfamily)
MKHTHYTDSNAFVTKDGSLIRELMHPGQHASRNQSLAEAIVRPGQKTALHQHQQSEELYHITAGKGHMTLGSDSFDVSTGDTVCISPGTAHCIENTGDTDLHILCCCAPAYAHTDTEIL